MMLRLFITLAMAMAVLIGCGASQGSSDQAIDQRDAIADDQAAVAPAQESTASAAPEPPANSADQDATNGSGLEGQDRDAQLDEFVTNFEEFRTRRVAELGHLPIGTIESTFGDAVFPQRLNAGPYTTTALGTELSFELPESAIVAREFPGMLSFIDLRLAATLHIARPNAIYTVDGALDNDRFFNYSTKTEPMPDDFDQWLRSITQIDIGDVEQTTVAGQPATRYELSPHEDEFFLCDRGTCLNLFHVGPDKIQLFGRQQAVLWHIPHPGGDLVIVAKANPEVNESWLEFTEEVVGSISLGKPSASPINSNQFWTGWGIVGPGEWTMPGVPWTLELGLEESAVNHKNGYLSIAPVTGPTEPRYGMTVAKFVETRAGATVTPETFDAQLREVYGDGPVVQEVEPAMVFGHEARVFDVGPNSRDLEFKHAADAPTVGPFGTDNYAQIPVSGKTRMWVFEHEGDLWVAAAGGDTEELVPTALALADEVFSTARLHDDAQLRLTQQFSPLVAGTYLNDALGFPLMLEMPEGWSVQLNGQGLLVLSPPDSAGTGDHDVLLVNPTSFGGDSPAAGIEAWLLGAPSTLLVSERQAMTIDARDAYWVDLRLTDDADCATSETLCLVLLSAGDFEKWLSVGDTYRLVWFGDATPAVLVLGAPETDEAWLDAGLKLVESLQFVDA